MATPRRNAPLQEEEGTHTRTSIGPNIRPEKAEKGKGKGQPKGKGKGKDGGKNQRPQAAAATAAAPAASAAPAAQVLAATVAAAGTPGGDFPPGAVGLDSWANVYLIHQPADEESENGPTD